MNAGSVKVLLFGAAADRAGTRETLVPAGGITPDELWPFLAGRYPKLSPLRDTLAFAANRG